jgi:hypothetical protein
LKLILGETRESSSVNYSTAIFTVVSIMSKLSKGCMLQGLKTSVPRISSIVEVVLLFNFGGRDEVEELMQDIWNVEVEDVMQYVWNGKWRSTL